MEFLFEDKKYRIKEYLDYDRVVRLPDGRFIQVKTAKETIPLQPVEWNVYMIWENDYIKAKFVA